MNEAIKSKTVLNAMFLNQSILNNLSTAILSLDKDLNFCFINQAAESLLDVSLKQVSGKFIFEVLPSFKNIENINTSNFGRKYYSWRYRKNPYDNLSSKRSESTRI